LKKPIGYSAFEGYNKKEFYFYDRDKKDSVRVVEVNKDKIVRDICMKFAVPDFQIDQFHRTGKKRH
jgi:hypothetical protein